MEKFSNYRWYRERFEEKEDEFSMTQYKVYMGSVAACFAEISKGIWHVPNQMFMCAKHLN